MDNLKLCPVENCENEIKIKGLCKRHNQQLHRRGYIVPEKLFHRPNKIVYCDGYAELILENNKLEEVARTKIDLDDVVNVTQHRWGYQGGYAYNKQIGMLHRFLLNPPDDNIADHRDRDRLNNRRYNLRECNPSQNGMNKSLQKNNKSSVVGVSWRKDTQKWRAYIKIEYRQIILGSYVDFSDAVEARRKAEMKYFGEFSPNIETDTNKQEKGVEK